MQKTLYNMYNELTLYDLWPFYKNEINKKRRAKVCFLARDAYTYVL